MKERGFAAPISRRGIALAWLCAGAVVLLSPLSQTQTLTELRAAHKAAYDPHGMQLLRQMVGAYAQVTSLDQTSEFSILRTPVLTPKQQEQKDKEAFAHPAGTLARAPVEKSMGRSVRLLLAAPNHLRLETTESDGEKAKPQTFLSVCDGKTFWTYDSIKNQYTRQHAPKQWRDFQKVTLANTTLELMMTMGLNPFNNIENQFDGVKYEGIEEVRGIQTDVVTLVSASEQQTQTLRFYIGTDDLLLHRLVVESAPILHTVKRPVRDPLDDLIVRPQKPAAPPAADPVKETAIPVSPGFEDPRPAAPLNAPTKIRITIDNSLIPDPQFTSQAFQYQPPQTASMYQGIYNSHELDKLSNTVTIDELLRKARSAKKGKKPRPISINL